MAASAGSRRRSCAITTAVQSGAEAEQGQCPSSGSGTAAAAEGRGVADTGSHAPVGAVGWQHAMQRVSSSSVQGSSCMPRFQHPFLPAPHCCGDARASAVGCRSSAGRAVAGTCAVHRLHEVRGVDHCRPVRTVGQALWAAFKAWSVCHQAHAERSVPSGREAMERLVLGRRGAYRYRRTSR